MYNAFIITATCLLLCLSFNYTFPLHRESSKWSPLENHPLQCKKPVQKNSIVDRTKKMVAEIETVLRKIIDSTSDNVKSIKDVPCSHNKLAFRDGDLSNYEQLVIMKKYPYLDIKELDSNYHPLPYKHIRQSLNSDSNVEVQDSSFCETNRGPIVEITNRGLSGFAIPKLLKTEQVPEKNTQPTDELVVNPENEIKTPLNLNRFSSDLPLMDSLMEDIGNFKEKIHV